MYCLAIIFLIASESSVKICIRINGSRSFWVSIITNKSLTLPCGKPNIHSPKRLIENLLSKSLTRLIISFVFMNKYLSNCSCDTGGKTHLRGLLLLDPIWLLIMIVGHAAVYGQWGRWIRWWTLKWTRWIRANVYHLFDYYYC